MNTRDELEKELHEIFSEVKEDFDKRDSDPPGTPRDSSIPPPKGNVDSEGEPEDSNAEPEEAEEEVGDDEAEEEDLDQLLDRAVDQFDELIATLNNLKGIFKQIRHLTQDEEE